MYIMIFCCIIHFLWYPSWPPDLPKFLFAHHFLIPLPAPSGTPDLYQCSCVLGGIVYLVAEKRASETKGEVVVNQCGQEAGEGRV